MVASKGSGLPKVAVKARRERGNDDHQNDQTRDDEQRELRPNSRFVTLETFAHKSLFSSGLIRDQPASCLN